MINFVQCGQRHLVASSCTILLLYPIISWNVSENLTLGRRQSVNQSLPLKKFERESKLLDYVDGANKISICFLIFSFLNDNKTKTRVWYWAVLHSCNVLNALINNHQYNSKMTSLINNHQQTQSWLLLSIIINKFKGDLFTYGEPQHLGRWSQVGHLRLGRASTCKQCQCFSFQLFLCPET